MNLFYMTKRSTPAVASFISGLATSLGCHQHVPRGRVASGAGAGWGHASSGAGAEAWWGMVGDGMEIHGMEIQI